ncbi:MAG TPA: hypothetical protein VFT19_04075 [Solirubrobacterales bacterium]|nr:hypothetical protein [Solirubrobacterales bacterium]
MRQMRLIGLAVLAAACAVTLAASAGAATVRVGKLVLQADGSFEPRALPKRTFAPIRFQGYGKIRKTDGTVPPALQHVKVDYDRDGRLTTAGLPVCAPGKLADATPRQARNRCRSAIVGTGQIAAVVPLPLLGKIEMRSPLTLFNGPHRDGNPTALLHAQAPFPIAETYVVVVPIERRRGAYRYRTEFDVPPIAGGLGAITRISAKVGRSYRAGGKSRSYISARCSDYILQTKGYFSFADGNVVYGSVFKPCTIRR